MNSEVYKFLAYLNSLSEKQYGKLTPAQVERGQQLIQQDKENVILYIKTNCPHKENKITRLLYNMDDAHSSRL